MSQVSAVVFKSTFAAAHDGDFNVQSVVEIRKARYIFTGYFNDVFFA
jgi:hypothetical protein